MESKPFKSVDDQIVILRERGWCQWVVAMSWLNASVGVR